MSHETFTCHCLFRAKGGVTQGVTECLRTGRAYRRPKTKRAPSGKGKIVDPVMISERPAEVEDRAVPGHWEGDLLMGRRQTAIGTLVERHTRYVMLFPLPEGNTAEAVRQPAGPPPCSGSLNTSGSPSPGIRARKWLNTPNSPSTPESKCISVIRSRLGSGEPTRIPTDCYVNTFPKAPT